MTSAAQQPVMPISGLYRGPGMIVLMTEWHLRVPLAELRRSVDLLMDHVEAATDGDAIHVDQDYFWSIPQDALYDVNHAEPKRGLSNSHDQRMSFLES